MLRSWSRRLALWAPLVCLVMLPAGRAAAEGHGLLPL